MATAKHDQPMSHQKVTLPTRPAGLSGGLTKRVIHTPLAKHTKLIPDKMLLVTSLAELMTNDVMNFMNDLFTFLQPQENDAERV